MRVPTSLGPWRGKYTRALALAISASLYLAQGAFAYNQRLASDFQDAQTVATDRASAGTRRPGT